VLLAANLFPAQEAKVLVAHLLRRAELELLTKDFNWVVRRPAAAFVCSHTKMITGWAIKLTFCCCLTCLTQHAGNAAAEAGGRRVHAPQAAGTAPRLALGCQRGFEVFGHLSHRY
jgi:hypothetical protein